MSTRQYTFDVEPSGDAYEALLRLAARWATSAMLVVREGLGLSQTANELLERLAEYRTSDTTLDRWPGTTLCEGVARISTYRLVPRVIELLVEASDSLYEWQQPERPEDLCLLRDDGTPWLVTVAHESDAYVVVRQSEFSALRAEVPSLAATLVEDHASESPRSP